MLVFVYGSLKKGFYNHSLIAPFEQVAKGTINGKMYSLGAFPAIVLSDNPEELVHGEIYNVNTPSGLASLDMLEGYNPESKYNFYNRISVKCKTNTGDVIDVLVYCFDNDKQMSLYQRPRVKDGIWKEGGFYG